MKQIDVMKGQHKSSSYKEVTSTQKVPIEDKNAIMNELNYNLNDPNYNPIEPNYNSNEPNYNPNEPITTRITSNFNIYPPFFLLGSRYWWKWFYLCLCSFSLASLIWKHQKASYVFFIITRF